jgi:hypothetical protein
MSGITDLKATREVLLELARIVKSTRQTLSAMIQASDWPGMLQPGWRSGQLADTLEHIEEVREGFILSQRMPAQATLSQLRALVQHLLLDWKWVQELDWRLDPADQIERLGSQLIVYNHALVALAVLPRLPAEAVTFPQPQSTYHDVAVPALPDEMLARIEEIERIIYQIEVRSSQSLAYGPLRRTYAFFEASSWLANHYLEPLIG